MIKILYSNKDSTLYERWSDLNTGLDEILELTKYVYTPYIYNSRIVLQFDTSYISNLIASGSITPTNFSASLQLKAVQVKSAPTTYTIECAPLAQQWDLGTGKFAYSPYFTDGVSWEYRSEISGSNWSGSTIYNNVSGGGSWYTSSIVSQSFNYSQNFQDVNINVTSIVKEWLTGSIANNGFILKLDSNTEQSSVPLTLQFFSSETNTIYYPRLVIAYNDIVYNTGSLSIIDTSKQVTLNVKNLKPEYYRNAVEYIRVTCRPTYPTRTFTTSSYYNVVYAMPSSSYYQIEDFYSGEVMIGYSEHTKLGCDGNTNYFKVDFSSLPANRFYRFTFKIESNNESTYYLFNNAFKVV